MAFIPAKSWERWLMRGLKWRGVEEATSDYKRPSHLGNALLRAELAWETAERNILWLIVTGSPQPQLVRTVNLSAPGLPDLGEWNSQVFLDQRTAGPV